MIETLHITLEAGDILLPRLQLLIPQDAQSYEESDKPVRFYARQDEEDKWTYGGRFYPDEAAILLPPSNDMARFAQWIREPVEDKEVSQ